MSKSIQSECVLDSTRNAELPMKFRVCPSRFQLTSFTYKEIEEKNEAKLVRIREECKEGTGESAKKLERIRKRFVVLSLL